MTKQAVIALYVIFAGGALCACAAVYFLMRWMLS